MTRATAPVEEEARFRPQRADASFTPAAAPQGEGLEAKVSALQAQLEEVRLTAAKAEAAALTVAPATAAEASESAVPSR